MFASVGGQVSVEHALVLLVLLDAETRVPCKRMRRNVEGGGTHEAVDARRRGHTYVTAHERVIPAGLPSAHTCNFPYYDDPFWAGLLNASVSH